MSPIPVGVNLACNLHNYLPMQFHLGILHKNAVSLRHSTQKMQYHFGKRPLLYLHAESRQGQLAAELVAEALP